MFESCWRYEGGIRTTLSKVLSLFIQRRDKEKGRPWGSHPLSTTEKLHPDSPGRDEESSRSLVGSARSLYCGTRDESSPVVNAHPGLVVLSLGNGSGADTQRGFKCLSFPARQRIANDSGLCPLP